MANTSNLFFTICYDASSATIYVKNNGHEYSELGRRCVRGLDGLRWALGRIGISSKFHSVVKMLIEDYRKMGYQSACEVSI